MIFLVCLDMCTYFYHDFMQSKAKFPNFPNKWILFREMLKTEHKLIKKCNNQAYVYSSKIIYFQDNSKGILISFINEKK